MDNRLLAAFLVIMIAAILTGSSRALKPAHGPTITGATRKLSQGSTSARAEVIATGGSASATSTATSIDGGTASAAAVSKSRDEGDAESNAQAVAGPGETSRAFANAESEDGRSANATAISLGGVEGVTTVANAIAEALGKGDGPSVALAISRAIPKGRKNEAVDALVEAYAIARTEANGPAFAEALAIGLLEGGETSEAFAAAAAKLLNEKGCRDTKLTFVDARATAISDGREREFLDALVFDEKIAECLFDVCDDEGVRDCCSSGSYVCECSSGSCKFAQFKEMPIPIWYCEDCDKAEKCLCPL